MTEASPTQANPSSEVFISYASQDFNDRVFD